MVPGGPWTDWNIREVKVGLTVEDDPVFQVALNEFMGIGDTPDTPTDFPTPDVLPDDHGYALMTGTHPTYSRFLPRGGREYVDMPLVVLYTADEVLFAGNPVDYSRGLEVHSFDNLEAGDMDSLLAACAAALEAT